MGVRKFYGWAFSLFLFATAVIGCHRGVISTKALEAIPKMTIEELRSRLRDPMLTIIDVRYALNWNKSNRKIPGAVREDPMELGSWTDRYPKDRMIVLYCD